ncbi:uncharacterized protein NPIL_511841 [Nephila pilipes]|uniref:Uncharacterized protein n=1 Tax=Nephila pilipes TaxID=299642 RepID=A0A8X6QZ53_NEPPI|nr:uncharacterized protein NPIL_511841 [Nephila pilipes]
MQSPKAILYLLTFRTPQITVSHGKTTQCRLSAAKLVRKTSCTKPPYFRVLQYIKVFRLHGLKKIPELPRYRKQKQNSFVIFNTPSDIRLLSAYHIDCFDSNSKVLQEDDLKEENANNANVPDEG